MDLHTWAQINMVGHVGWNDYLSQTAEESKACLQALEEVLAKSRPSPAQQSFEALVDKYRGGGGR